MLLCLIINASWVAPVIIKQDKKIATVESEASHSGDMYGAKFEQLTKKLELLETNMTVQITELNKKIEKMQKIINVKEAELLDAEAKILELEKTIFTNISARILAVQENMERMESDIKTLNATKANRESTDDKLAELNRMKADRTEVAVNLTLLREASSREDEDILQELRVLADNTLNHSHYAQLQQAWLHLNLSKASQADFENLSSEFEVLTNYTDTLHHSIGTVENTTLLLQQSIHELELNFTSLNGTVHRISATLTTKANQQALVTLSERVDSIDSSKVSTETFTELQSTVQGIQDSKAEQHDLDQLEGRVIMLEYNRATKTQLNSIESDLEHHTSSSDGVHTRLQSSIRTNTDNIDSNSDRITELENASPRLTGSWMTTIACVTLILVTLFVPLHT